MCLFLTDEKFTGGSFLVLNKEDFKELGCSFSARRLLGTLLDEVCRCDCVGQALCSRVLCIQEFIWGEKLRGFAHGLMWL